MEKNRFVFENFEEFLRNFDPLLEAKDDQGTELNLSGATELVDKIISLNIDLAENYLKNSDRSPESEIIVYGTKAIEELKKNEIGKATLNVLLFSTGVTPNIKVFKTIGFDIDLRDKKKSKKLFSDKVAAMSNDEALKLATAGLKAYGGANSEAVPLPFGFKTPILWGMLDDSDKSKVYDDFYKLAIKRGYNTKEGLDTVIQDQYKKRKNDKRSSLFSPGISVSLSKEDVAVEGSILYKEFKTYIINEEKESEVFKPNKTGANGADDFISGSFQEMIDNLGSIFQRYTIGEINSIKKINILTSADRYQNSGEATSLSWGQLSYARAVAMSKMIESMAEAAGLDNDIVAQLPKLTFIYAKGENGDGTSGPNAPEGKGFGYYVKGGKNVNWIAGKNRDEVVIIPIDEDGTPTKDSAKGISPKKEPVLTDPAQYNKFRYNNIEIVYEAQVVKSPDKEITSEKIIDLKYPVTIRIPSRYQKTTIKIPLPVIEKSYSSSGGGSKNSEKCPGFGQSTRTNFGITFRKVNVASWQNDLTK